jgi:hypothetical protein
MKIDKNQIETKAYAGKSGDGSPLVYVVTKGGLHIFFKKTEDGIESIAAAPHRGIAQFMAESKDKEIKWDKDFLVKSDEDFLASDSQVFENFRKVFFAPERVQKTEKSSVYMVYDTGQASIELLQKDEVSVANFNPYCLVRNLALCEPIYLLRDHPDFKESK